MFGKTFIAYQLTVSSMWLKAFFAAVVSKDPYNGIVQPVVGTVLDSGIVAGADDGDGPCSDSQK